jgi:uncharacterized phage infection (PIP) family protein YhgE
VGIAVTDSQLHNDLVTANSSLAQIRVDADSLKTGVQQLHADLGGLRSDVQNLVPIIDAITGLRSDVQGFVKNIATDAAGLNSNLATIIDLLKIISSAVIDAHIVGDLSSALEKKQPLPPP